MRNSFTITIQTEITDQHGIEAVELLKKLVQTFTYKRRIKTVFQACDDDKAVLFGDMGTVVGSEIEEFRDEDGERGVRLKLELKTV